MPASADKLLGLLALDDPASRTFAALGPAGRLNPGAQLPEPQGVFPRYVDPAAEAKKSGSMSAEEQEAAKAAKKAKKEANRQKSAGEGGG
jgi:methionyl-tRNA synthetase